MRNIIRALGLIILMVGVIFLVFGIRSTNEFGQRVTETMQGTYSEGTRSDIIGGSIAIAVGIVLFGCSWFCRRK